MTKFTFLWYNYIKESERKKNKVVYVDIYNDIDCTHIASFEIEFDWQLEDLVDFEDVLTIKGVKFFEITTYQQEV